MVGVEIGDADRTDQALLLEPCKGTNGVQIGWMLIHPPMQLHEIDTLDIHALACALDGSAHERGTHDAGFRAPFGEGPEWRNLAGALLARQGTDDQLGAAIMVSHVEG